MNYIPYKQKLVSKARELRKEMTEAEKKLWFEVLRDSWKTGYKFTRQKPLGEFIADFYSAKLLLVIEVDGDSHAESKERDQERTNYLKNKYNIEVIRYQNEDVLNNLESVYNDLVKKLSVRFIVINNPPDKGDTGGYE